MLSTVSISGHIDKWSIFPFWPFYGSFGLAGLLTHPKGNRVVAAHPCWKWLQRPRQPGVERWNQPANDLQMVGFPASMLAPNVMLWQLVTKHLFFTILWVLEEGMLTFLSTCSCHLCFVNIGLGWTVGMLHVNCLFTHVMYASWYIGIWVHIHINVTISY